MPKATRKGKSKLVYFEAPHIPEDNTVKHRYTLFSSTKAGYLTQKTSTLKTTITQSGPESGSNIDIDETHVVTDTSLDVHSNDIPNDADDPSSSIDPLFDAAYVQHLEDTGNDDKIKRNRPKGDEALRDFVPQIDLFLEELIALESRGRWPSDICARCQNPGTGEYQCVECGTREMLCRQCIMETHEGLYLHRILKWNESYFEKTSLKSLGLRKQLGHPRGEPCRNPISCSGDDFVVLHSNGIHEIGLDFCGCGSDTQLHTVQLLRARLFPATVTNPKTAATMEVLDLFEILSYESKMSAFQFYYSLSRLTDNTGMRTPKDRYPSFLRMIHEWRHLSMLKRAGRGHDPKGVATTKEGECAVLCPACPQPGKNMPENWTERPKEFQFLDTLFISIDANFRLKRKNVSSHDSDPGLSKGYSYFVEETRYREHLKNYISEKEPKSSCSRHDAVNLSETKPGQGHAVTGVGAVVCSRHDMKRPNAVAQLQKGERYCNMDYIFHSTMKNTEVKTFVISYDIVCYSPGSDFFLFQEGRQVTFLVPKFHLPAHVAKCRTQFSFNLTKNVGRTEGESPERGWVGPNALAPSASLLRKVMAAARDMAEHVIGHQELESTISRESLDEWTKEVEAWEANSSLRNPFESTVSGPTQAAVRRALAEEEQCLLEQGKDFSLDDEVTPSVLISTGIDLENEQRSYKEACLKLWDHALDRQHTKIILRGNTLIRKIEAWEKYQVLYLPAVARLRDASLRKLDHTAELKAHELSLWLPSQIKNLIAVPEQYRRLEFDLRIPQASEALDDLRAQLQFKDRFVRGQGANTRARNTLDGIQKRINTAANEYRVAYDALSCLGTMLDETEWQNDFLPLKSEDIRDLSEGKAKQSEGKREISWIWRRVAVDRIDKPQADHFREGVRIEWAKSRARANRFTEEVSLLTEEMMRVQRFFAWKASDWESKADVTAWQSGDSMSEMRAEGLIAYAKRQAGMYLWKDVPAYIARMQAIIFDPSLALPGEFDAPKITKS
ncbi:hypothetical protein BJ912DRAFT_933216 [Pholiota molesta]|nr:hypothetical protein BJ912DRAFT_933216 [Pholiota molesta]